MLTAAVRDLARAHSDKFLISVDTAASALWNNNPYIAPPSPGAEIIKCEYPLIHWSNTHPFHFIHGFRQFLQERLGVMIPTGEFKGDVHLSDQEKSWLSQAEELKVREDFWIVMAGGKFDFTAKWWNPKFWQKVVDHFRGKITFVQCGELAHWHPPLKGVINLIGKTDIRQFVRLVYHSVGVLCPVTLAMHLAAAVPTKPGRPLNRACVVVAGGREPSQWEAYPHHQFLHTNGALRCCDNGGCWKSRCQKVGDGDEKDSNGLCVDPVKISDELSIPKCMNMIKPHDVIRAIERYYDGGALKFNRDLATNLQS
jgi:ADP-heptose:LPS heptosyltransferase